DDRAPGVLRPRRPRTAAPPPALRRSNRAEGEPMTALLDATAPARRVWSGAMENPAPAARTARFAAGLFFGLVAVQLTFHMALNELLNGACTGLLYGLIAVGIILIYKTNRIINFAAAAVGAVPAIFALLLDVQRGFNYLVVLPIALIGGPLVAGLVDIVIMRRF